MLMSSIPDSPEGQLQLGKFAADMERKTTRLLQLHNITGTEFKHEIGFTGVKRDLAWRHRHRLYLDTGKVQVDQLANALHRTNLEMGRQPVAKLFRIALSSDRQDECRAAQQLAICHRADHHPVLALLQRQLQSLLLKYHRQHSAQPRHQPSKACALVAMEVTHLKIGAFAV